MVPALMTLDAPDALRDFGPEAAATLREVVPADRLLLRPIDRIAFASDASFYRLVPRGIALARSVDEVRGLFRFSQQHGVPLTFRAAGTSLSGQAITDGLLVEVARHWKQVAVEDGGRRVRLQPGVIGGHANRALAAHGARLGPDPASINACTIGGILANNSSGMCCGVEQNAYHTLESLTFVLPSGTRIDTAHPDADLEFRAREPQLAEGLLSLKRRIESCPALRDRIRSKYRTKNTTGYSLNAFLDFDRAVDIMRHVLIGSEGTLGFIAEAVLRTVPDLPIRHTGLLLFADLHAACAAIVPLRDAGAVALELMDRAAMRSVEHQPGVPDIVRVAPGRAAGLLVEFQAAVEADRPAMASAARETSSRLALLAPPLFTDDPSTQARLWTMRKGMFPSVGAVRRSGTTVIIEDVAFPIDRLANAAVDLTTLFAHHGYDDAIIFGHAKDGNLHFVLSQSFNTPAAVDQYARFMDDVVALVVGRYDGALKAEHGTGRNMAPFVEAEWGPEAVAIMAELKALADPRGLLNPGVILNPDPRAHLADLKPLPAVEPEVDKCIECGYCEPLCPSRTLTLTPRQRIVVRRELARLEGLVEQAQWRAEIDAAFPYDVLDTCAADGLCATACPVAIDTGQLVKRFRALRSSARERSLAAWAAEHFDLVEAAARWALRAGRAADTTLGTAATARAVAMVGALIRTTLPTWTGDAPRVAPSWRRLMDCPARAASRDGAAAVYFPTCITRIMSPAETGGRSPNAERQTVVEALVRIAARAGRPLWIPDEARGTCCGVPFASKGFDEAHRVAANRIVERFWDWSDEGRLPIVIDTSPCTFGARTCREVLSPENCRRFDRLTIVDAVEFVHDDLLPRLRPVPLGGTTVVHPVCSIVKMNLTGKLEAIAAGCSERATLPLAAGCCGFAGDRGFLVPELTRAALQSEAAEVRSIDGERHVSSSRTCEVGLTRATGRVYRSFLHLVDEATSQDVLSD
ncbi:MAG: linked oxidase-like protein [Acidobacteria bacterium]|nr:linked oxidase-like protein [Acidobacteriota bacterium]